MLGYVKGQESAFPFLILCYFSKRIKKFINDGIIAEDKVEYRRLSDMFFWGLNSHCLEYCLPPGNRQPAIQTSKLL